jgi:hypothetical protein
MSHSWNSAFLRMVNEANTLLIPVQSFLERLPTLDVHVCKNNFGPGYHENLNSLGPNPLCCTSKFSMTMTSDTRDNGNFSIKVFQ